jgi:hypothetical protein
MKTPQILQLGSLGLIVVSLIGAASLQAQSTIATYDIGANTGGSDVTPTTASGVTAATLTTTASAGTGFAGTYAKTLWGAATSLDPTKYMTWSVTPTAGNQIDFAGANATFSLTFNGDSPGGPHGADTWDLHASLNNFTGSDITLATGMSLGTTFLAQVPESVPLGALATQIGTVTFRLYGYNDTKQVAGQDSAGLANAGAPFTGTGGNLLISGTVSAVPEPSSYAAVFGALAFGFAFITRRLRKA